MNSLAPLAHSPFRRLLAGRVVSLLGNAVAPIALAFAVLDLTGSVASLGLVVGARSITIVVFLLFGGVLADRLPRQTVLLASSGASAASQAAVAVLVLTGAATVPWLIVLSAINGMVTAMTFPAAAALTPQTVPAAVLQQANALGRLGINGAMIVGASLGGVLVAVVGPGWGLVLDAVTFLVGGACFAFVRVPDVRRKGTTHTLTELREGWTEFRSRTWVWVVVVAFAFFNAALVGGVFVLGPAVADDTIGRSSWGLVLATQTAGMFVGGLVALRIRVRRLLLLGAACAGGEALLVLGLALAPVLPVLLVTGLLAGVAIEQFGVAWETSLQQATPPDRLARVYSYDALGSLIAIPAGEIAVGPVAGAVGLRPTLLGAATVIVLATVAMVATPSVRALENRPGFVPDLAGEAPSEPRAGTAAAPVASSEPDTACKPDTSLAPATSFTPGSPSAPAPAVDLVLGDPVREQAPAEARRHG